MGVWPIPLLHHLITTKQTLVPKAITSKIICFYLCTEGGGGDVLSIFIYVSGQHIEVLGFALWVQILN